ncbi:MAG: hypothetical protein KME59_25425 [Trichormus sp. ATA11-4-KO1]|jgi:hypothetical protein|nr:hypothetical protein [Trichormus sp. ATA11-4-KO1]
MPYTKEALQNMYSLSLEDVLATLTACGLSHDTQEYSDAEIESGFDVVRQLFTSGQASDYQQATTLFQQSLENSSSESSTESNSQSGTEPKNGRKKSRKKTQFPIDVTELLVIARDQGFKLTLSQALIILQACGLSEQDEYSSDECDRFLETCKSIKQQDKSFEEVIADLTVPQTNESSEQLELEAVIESVSEKAVAARVDLSSLVDKITAVQAQDVPELVQSLYLKNVALKLQQSDSENNLFAQLEERIMARIEQKKQQRQELSGMTWETKPLEPSSEKLMLSPNVSENGTNTD